MTARDGRAALTVRTERTPNPLAVKFLPDGPVAAAPSHHRRGARVSHPFLDAVFAVPQVESVFLGADFVSVSLDPDGPGWDGDVTGLKDRVASIVAEHAGGMDSIPVRGEAAAPPDDAVVARILEVLETRVRPAVAADGGDIVFEDYGDGVLRLRMRGACAGCPSAAATLRMGILNLMRHFVPEVRDVREAA